MLLPLRIQLVRIWRCRVDLFAFILSAQCFGRGLKACVPRWFPSKQRIPSFSEKEPTRWWRIHEFFRTEINKAFRRERLSIYQVAPGARYLLLKRIPETSTV